MSSQDEDMLSAVLARANAGKAGDDTPEEPAGEAPAKRPRKPSESKTRARKPSEAKKPPRKTTRSTSERKTRPRSDSEQPETTATKGRAKTGKRSDPDFVQVGFWISRKASAQLDIEIAHAQGEGEEIGDRSDVVERQILAWAAKRKANRQ